jgi:hypothetical protein
MALPAKALQFLCMPIERPDMTPFIVYALPRSRTFWISRFLTYGEAICGHEQIRYVRGLDDVKSLLGMPCYGSAETAAAPFWRLIQAIRPDIKTIVIRRPVAEVVESLIATGVAFDRALLMKQMRALDAKLDQIEQRVPGVMSIAYDDLNDEAVCARLFEYCTGQKHGHEHWAALASQNLTCDLPAMMRHYHAHKPQIDRVARQAKQRMLAKLARRPVSSDAMTFQQEPFDTFLEGAQKLFPQHLIEVGERPEAWSEKNLDLMRTLESIGALYVTTARSNGRMFGYLMSIVSPALDSRSLDATQTTFFASPDAPGIGAKLQRASIEFLRSRGVNQVCFRAGTRGTGAKMGALYRRLGAESTGETFMLQLKEFA